LIEIDTHISTLLKEKPALLDFSKWGVFLPNKFKIKLVKNNYFDIEKTEQLLTTMRIIENK
jgi:ATP-dependent Lhr-like helicase